MKRIAVAFVLILFAFRSPAQNSTADAQAIAMLKQFYTLYNLTWAYGSPYSSKMPFKVFQEKVDLLRKKYCTRKLYNNIKNDWDYDFLIADMYADSTHLKTLTVVKDRAEARHYMVSYIAHKTMGKVKELHMSFDVCVEKEDGDYKISTVYNQTQHPD
jgi:hypothetical protein